MSDQPTKQNPSTSPQKSSQAITTLRREMEAYSGPIPPPSMLAEYNQVLPDAAERILKLAEDQSKHRQYLERRVIDADVLNSRLGVIFGFVVAMGFLVGAVICALNNHPVVGSFLGTGGLTGLVTVFVYGTKSRKEERAENYKRNQEKPHK